MGAGESLIITKHAKKRLKQRIGLKPRAMLRHAIRAFKNGVIAVEHQNKNIAAWFRGEQEKDKSIMYVIFGSWVYIFGLSEDRVPVLVTVYKLEVGE